MASAMARATATNRMARSNKTRTGVPGTNKRPAARRNYSAAQSFRRCQVGETRCGSAVAAALLAATLVSAQAAPSDQDIGLSLFLVFAAVAVVIGVVSLTVGFTILVKDLRAAARRRAKQSKEERQKAAARKRAKQQEEEEQQKTAAREHARQQEEEERQRAEAARKRQREQEEAAARERARQQKEQESRRNPTQGKLSEPQALEILGLNAGATNEEIRAAYNRLMKRVHPDVGGSNFFAKQLNEAREALCGAL
jgi:UPF0716 family protein affecting phage T7 exclusion